MCTSLLLCILINDVTILTSKVLSNKDPNAGILSYSDPVLWGKIFRSIGQFIAFMILLFMFWGYTLLG